MFTSLWHREQALSHINLGQQADLVLLAPATANLIAKAANGIADDLLTTILLACKAPILVAPAMNDKMWANPVTARNVRLLSDRGWIFAGPAIGDLAEGPSDNPGRMLEAAEIVAHAVRKLRSSISKLNGKSVLVTAGPTREQIDPVRLVSNPSSGRMGYSIAAAAFARGASVSLLTGPSQLDVPHGIDVSRVETTRELRDAVANSIGSADVVIMAAAPSDYRPSTASQHKLQKTAGGISISLEPTVDVLLDTVSQRKPDAVVVGFALESQDGVNRAREKLIRKQLDLIVLNMAGEEGSGFETKSNRVSVVTRETVEDLPLLAKNEVAERLLDRVEELL